MGKIGLLTSTHAVNYGAVLQAFSLKKTVEDLTMEDVEIINYCGDEWKAGRKIFRKNNNIKNTIINLLILVNFNYRKSRKKLFKEFDDFKHKYLNIQGTLLTDRKMLLKMPPYETYICGSDQIWNLNLFNDPVYLLDFTDRKAKKIAYAVSISDHLTDEQMMYIADKVKDFSFLSIREKDDSIRMSEFLDAPIDNVIDPVFLHSRNEWCELLGLRQCTDENYIFVFLISHSASDRKLVEKIKGNNKVIVLNLHPVNYIRGDNTLHDCSPSEFVGLIANAQAIITDSFHCTAFSVIFNKIFYNIVRSSRNNRIKNMCEKLSIPSRFCDITAIPSKEIDYDTVNHFIDIEKNNGKAFIMKAMGID